MAFLLEISKHVCQAVKPTSVLVFHSIHYGVVDLKSKGKGVQIICVNFVFL
jgi:hypothetical protein